MLIIISVSTNKGGVRELWWCGLILLPVYHTNSELSATEKSGPVNSLLHPYFQNPTFVPVHKY